MQGRGRHAAASEPAVERGAPRLRAVHPTGSGLARLFVALRLLPRLLRVTFSPVGLVNHRARTQEIGKRGLWGRSADLGARPDNHSGAHPRAFASCTRTHRSSHTRNMPVPLRAGNRGWDQHARACMCANERPTPTSETITRTHANAHGVFVCSSIWHAGERTLLHPVATTYPRACNH